MVSVDQVWKRYRRRGYRTLREELAACFRPRREADAADFWALREVSLSVEPGEAVGLIGPNGSGKTTLLKLLAGISRPTRGTVAVRGRKAALIELGAGFHPELTGRENIYLNGAVLGMGRGEIRRREEAIVAFAEMAEFLDLPLKRYSSGMVVRLGFAVAAHAEAEVLLLDEVLAVGDARFQRRCLDRMRALREQGTTLLLVSHQLATVGLFCQRAVWLDRGVVASSGPAAEVIQAYQQEASRVDPPAGPGAPGDLLVCEGVRLLGEDGREAQAFHYREPLCVRVAYRCRERLAAPRFTLTVRGPEGRLFQASMLLDGRQPAALEGAGELDCRFHSLPLAPGAYHLVLSVKGEDGVSFLMLPRVVAGFTVAEELGPYGWAAEGARAFLPEIAPVIVPYEWRFHRDGEAG